MFYRYWKLVGIALSLVFVIPAVAQDKKKSDGKKTREEKPAAAEKPDSIESVLNIDPTGRPDMSARDGTKIYLWRDDDGWHLRTNAKDRKGKKNFVTLSGVIQVDDGRVTGLQATEGLEPRKKGKERRWLG
jgi:hypothetical protein